MRNRRYQILFFLFFPAFLYAQQKGTRVDKKDLPNVILIFMDDMGYGDLGVTGALDYQTPILDQMANHGIRFTNFLVPQAVCSASRAALLTGNYPNRMGVHGAYMPNAKAGLKSSEITIAEMLKSKGYRTYMVGKWHLGNEPEFLPTKQGFDGYVGLPYSNDMWPVEFDGSPAKKGGRVAHYPKLPLLQSKVGQEIPDTIGIIKDLKDQATLTQRYTKEAVDYIKKHKKDRFFLYLAHNMTHAPIAASEKFIGKTKQGLYGDVMAEIDWSMGTILQALKDAKIEDNTIVIFTSDNGPWLNFGNHNGSSGGFREGKGTSWEGGQRVPCIIQWPKIIKQGRIENNLSSSMDIFATLADIVNYQDHPFQIDGLSFLPNLKDAEAKPHRDRMYYYYNKNDLEAVRLENWKLVFPHRYRSYEDILPGNEGIGGKYNSKTVDSLMLFDLRRDPAERYNVIEQHPDVKEKLLQMAEEARADLGDNLTNRKGVGKRN